LARPGDIRQPSRPELPVVAGGTYGVTHIRRTRAAMHHRLAVVSSMVGLILVTLLARGTGLSASLPREASAAVVALASIAERGVERGHEGPLEHSGAARRTMFRATAPAIPRVHTTTGAGGTDGPRPAVALDADRGRLELVARRAAAHATDARRRPAAPPDESAAAPRAPPVA
jgi:hypothetical protein